MEQLQRTDEWHSDRLGKVTASKIADIMPNSKGTYSASREKYLLQLISERLSLERTETHVTAPMQRGIDLESTARDLYILKSFDAEVVEVGVYSSPDH